MTLASCSSLNSQPSTFNRFKRRRWESNPLDAALQAAATPRDFSVVTKVSSPGVEPGPRPSQSRVPPPHPEDGELLRVEGLGLMVRKDNGSSLL